MNNEQKYTRYSHTPPTLIDVNHSIIAYFCGNFKNRMSSFSEMQWFENWFDSPYYHILYKDRNEKEAELFIDNLINLLTPNTNDKFLDMPCGKGRHAVYLNKKGFNTIGIDLSQENIAHALQYQNNDLQFYVQDMRKPFRVNYFNYVLNLFTSFGYFENDRDNLAVIQTAQKALKQNGIFVIDFMNAQKVITSLVKKEEKQMDGITFLIEKKLENQFITKQIRFKDKGQEYDFIEKVKALTLADFENYFKKTSFKIIHLFGSYRLDPFDINTSDRLIIIAKKEQQ